MHVIRLRLFVYTGIVGICMLGTAAAEQEPVLLRRHGDLWLGADVGAGAIHLEWPQGSISENKFYLGFRGEYVLSPEWLLGIEVSGWLIQPGEIETNTNPPPANFERQIEGEGLAPILLTVRFYPWDDASWYLKAGAGYVSHWQTHLGETVRESGTDVMLGGGYDFYINDNWDMTAFLTYSSGSVGDEDYDAITLALGFSYKIRRK